MTDFEEDLPEYTLSLLENAYEKMASIRGESKKFTIGVAPIIESKDRKTYFKNFEIICKKLNRDHSEVKDYLEKRLNVISSMCDSGLKIDCVIQKTKVELALTSYVTEFVLCTFCKSGKTSYEKRDRLTYFVCGNCKAEKTIKLQK